MDFFMKKMLSILLALMVIMGCMSSASAEEVKPVILVVSFGTSYDDNRDLSIGAVEADIAAAFPEYEVRRAFTAQTVIDILDVAVRPMLCGVFHDQRESGQKRRKYPSSDRQTCHWRSGGAGKGHAV